MSNKSPELTSVLLAEILDVATAAHDSFVQGNVQPKKRRYAQWKLTKAFEYNERGVVDRSARGEVVYRQDWSFSAARFVARYQDIDKIIAALSSEFPSKAEYVGAWIRRLIEICVKEVFENAALDNHAIKQRIAEFVEELSRDTIEYRADVELTGLAVLTDPITIQRDSRSYTIRAITQADLEKEVPEFRMDTLPGLSKASAILELTCLATDLNDVQRLVQQAITILCLYRRGSIGAAQYQITSKAIRELASGVIISSNEFERWNDVSPMVGQDSAELRAFWEFIENRLPEALYWHQPPRPDFLMIAYERYRTAELSGRSIEERIAVAMMGMEAIWSTDNIELNWKIQIRVASVLALRGYAPRDVRRVINSAYGIRSAFVHGDYPAERAAKKIAREHGSVNGLASATFDLLRESIYLLIAIEGTKKDWIELVDSALVETSPRAKLRKLLSSIPLSKAREIAARQEIETAEEGEHQVQRTLGGEDSDEHPRDPRSLPFTDAL